MRHLKRYQIQMLVDGELSGKEIERVESHLDKCARCRELNNKVQEQIGELKTVIGDLDPVDVQIPELDLSAGTEVKPEKRYVRVPVPAFAAMLTLILFLGTLLVFQSFQRSVKDYSTDIIPAVQYVKFESGDSMKVNAIQLDLSDYSIIKKPKIMVIKGEGKKDEKI